MEIKLPVTDLAAVRGRISAAGFYETGPRSFEANVLYDTADSALRNTHRMLRLRVWGGKTVLTFKGAPLPGRHKQREELETVVESGATLALMLARLGYEPVFRYEKFRQIFRRGDERAVIAVDETPIGPFLELEGDSEWIDETAAELGFCEEDYITASYAVLYTEYCRKHALEPAHFVFPSGGSESTDANG